MNHHHHNFHETRYKKLKKAYRIYIYDSKCKSPTPPPLSGKSKHTPHVVVRDVEIAGITLRVGILHAVPFVILNVVVQIEAKVSGGEIIATLVGALLYDVADVVIGGAGDFEVN